MTTEFNSTGSGLSLEERALLNEETMLGTEDRIFCGIELLRMSATSQRYIQRIMAKLNSYGGTAAEAVMAYGFALSVPVADGVVQVDGKSVPRIGLRSLARDMNVFEQALDAWIEALPNPVPPEEMEKLTKIVERDVARIEAAKIKVEPKPGDSSSEGAVPPNS